MSSSELGSSDAGGSGLSRSSRWLAAGTDFHLIPNEIALAIFGYLDMKDLLSISQTCKHWNAISEDDTLWKPLYKNRWSLPEAIKAPAPEVRSTNKPATKARRVRMEQQERMRLLAGGSSATGSSSRRARKAHESDQDQIEGWRSWKSKYVARRNWLAGRVVYHTGINIHSPNEAESILCLRFDHEKYAAGSTDGNVYIRAVDDGGARQTLTGHRQAVTCLQIEHGLLVSGSKDNTVKIWRGPMGEQECVHTLTAHRSPISCLQFVGNRLMTRSWDLTGRVWDLNTGQLVHTVTYLQLPQTLNILKSHIDLFRSNSICKTMQIDGHKMICGYTDASIRLWDLRTGKCHRVLYGHGDVVTALSANDVHLASGSYDKTLRLWDIRIFQNISTFYQHKAHVHAVQLQGNRIVSAGADGTVKVWNTQTKQNIFDLKGHKCAVTDVQFDEKKVGSADISGSIKIWNFAEVMSY